MVAQASHHHADAKYCMSQGAQCLFTYVTYVN